MAKKQRTRKPPRKNLDGEYASARKRAAPPNVEALFAKAVIGLHQGKEAFAVPIFEQILSIAPDHPDTLHMMGFLAFRHGRVDESAELIGRAIALQPDNPAFQGNFGAVMNEMGLWEQAEAACRKAIDLAPGYPDALNNLAISLSEQGRLEEAGEACAEAIESRPDFPPIRITLGNLRRRQGRLEEAVEAYREAVSLAPGNALAQGSLGAALREVGRLEEAEAACRRAVELAPHQAEAQVVLGTVLLARNEGEGALAAFRKAADLNPGHAEARLDLAAALFRLGRAEEALEAYREAGAISVAAARARDGLGVVLLAVGRLVEARAAFREALDLDPHLAVTWYNLSSAGEKFTPADQAAMEGLLKQESLPDKGRSALHFALGDLHDRAGRLAEAFEHYRQGNELRHRSFDADGHDRRVEAIVAAFPAGAFAGWTREGASELPVFVVGMPRSGTSLVEQIAASHPMVFGAGELDAVAGLEPDGAAAHLARLQALAPWAARVVDKTPNNFLHLGAIARMFPGARVIHCRRDARDTALSCYQQNFAAGHAWTARMAGIARYHAAYLRLMAHWREVLPLPLLEIAYEDLVAEPEGQSRRLVEFLGLPWDPACLEFHKTERLVRTASAAQVRQPIHGGSVGRWKAYAPFVSDWPG